MALVNFFMDLGENKKPQSNDQGFLHSGEGYFTESVATESTFIESVEGVTMVVST